MSGVLLGAAALALLTGTGVLVAATLGLRNLADFIVAAYVVSFAEVVGLTLLLSAFGAVTRPALLVGMSLLLLASIAGWLLRGMPPFPRFPRALFRGLARNPTVLVLTVAVSLALAYVVALIIGTPPNTWDSLTYHLARAAFWRQEGGVGYIAHAYDQRLNANPPNGEVSLMFVLELTRNERLAGFVQFAAWLACAVGVVAISRRLGLTREQAMFGGLLFLLLPIVLLEASTTQNDLVVASLLLAAAVFVMGRSWSELGLVVLAIGLAIGTKVTAVYGLPVLCAVALAAPPRTHRIARVAALAIGAVAGSYWYLVNVIHTRRPLGERPDTEVLAVLNPEENLLAAYARTLDAFDLSGAEGADLFLYALVAAFVAIGLLFRPGTGRRKVFPALVTGALIVMPIGLVLLSYPLWRVFAKLHNVLGGPDNGLPVAGWEIQNSASESFSWFGPLGFLLVLGVGTAAVVLFRRGSLPLLAVVVAAAPFAWLVLVSVSLGYDPWQGRFFMFPVALSASLWGLVLAIRPVATATVAIAATTAALTLVHFIEKPSGIRLLADDPPTSIWSMERWQAQSVLRTDMGPVLRFLEYRVPRDASIALALGEDDFGYPAFGADLARHVRLVSEGPLGDGATDAEWLVASEKRAKQIKRRCWRRIFLAPDGWRVFRRAVAGCPP